jgi:predicted TIM-barrel enzyme
MTIDSQRSFTRSSILDRLHAVIREGRPIVAAGSSAGIVAKSAEKGGADLIIVYSTGRSRLMGVPTTPLGHSNPITMSMYREIDNVVVDTPIIGGAEAGDPTYQRISRLVDDYVATGFDGLINFPSAGRTLELARTREHIGQGLRREGELVAAARARDVFTMGYAYNVEHTRILTEAGVDVLVPHSGWTRGGEAGASDQARDMHASIALTQELIEVARSINPGVICLAHGGAIATPEDTKLLYEESDAQGFVGASSIERIPIEQAVAQVVRDFADHRLRTPVTTFTPGS